MAAAETHNLNELASTPLDVSDASCQTMWFDERTKWSLLHNVRTIHYVLRCAPNVKIKRAVRHTLASFPSRCGVHTPLSTSRTENTLFRPRTLWHPAEASVAKRSCTLWIVSFKWRKLCLATTPWWLYRTTDILCALVCFCLFYLILLSWQLSRVTDFI